ncbi:MAG TPA: AsmA-like C-terminal region-containing protein, partial [Pirellulaceae bacterium]
IEGSAQWPDFADLGPLTIRGTAKRITVDAMLWASLPPAITQACEQFQPRGDADAEFELVRRDGRWQPRVQVTCRDAVFEWRKFPYPIEGVRGTLHFQPGLARFQCAGRATHRPVEIRGEIHEPGPAWTGWFDYRSLQPVPLDERLMAALPPRIQHPLKAFSPQGLFTITGRGSRSHPGDRVVFQAAIDVVDGAVRHEAFPYPLQNVRGHIEQHDRTFHFSNFVGRNDPGRFASAGTWEGYETGGGRLSLRIQGVRVPLDDELRSALHPTVRGLWSQMRPAGQIDSAQVDYELDTRSGRRQVRAEFEEGPSEGAEESELSLKPRAFPYRLDQVVGKASYHNGIMSWTRFRARHGRVHLTTNGTAQVRPDGTWSMRLTDLLVDRCRPEHDLIVALPTRLRRLIEATRPEGDLTLQGAVQFDGVAGIPTATRSTWDLLADVEDARVDGSIPLRNVSGTIRVAGFATPDRLECRGHLDLDRVVARDLHCATVRGPFVADDLRVRLGAWATQPSRGPPEAAGAPSPEPSAEHLTARTLGGTIAVDMEASTSPSGQFSVQGSARDMDVAQIAREFGKQGVLKQGRASASFQLTGQAREIHTWNGGGHVVVQDTNLYELPVFLAMFKQMRTGSRDRVAFDASEITYRMQGTHIYFDQIDLKGDALTLKGVGEMSLRRDLNLNFYTVMGREESYLPAVRPLLGLASQRFLLIRVEGSLDNLQTSREVLPGLNATLERLFPEAVATRSTPLPRPGTVRTVAGP